MSLGAATDEVSAEDRETFDHLVTWMVSLRVTEGRLEPETLVSCGSFASVLHKIDENHFDEDWVEKITSQYSSKQTIRANNLRKVLDRLRDYIERVMQYDTKKQARFKVDAENFSDIPQLLIVMRLIVFAAFLGKNNNDFVMGAGNLAPDVQKTVMEAVRELMDDFSKREHTRDSDHESSTANGSALSGAEIERMAELEKENTDLKEKQRVMSVEIDGLKQKVYSMTNGKNDNVETYEQEILDLRGKRQILQEQLIEAETERDIFRAKYEEMSLDNETMLKRIETLRPFEEDFQKKTDELQELKEKEIEFNKVKRENETLKKKIKEEQNEKEELKFLKGKVDFYVSKVVQLEEEEKKNKTLHGRVVSLDALLKEKDTHCNSLLVQTTKLEHDIKTAKEKLAHAEMRNSRLEREKMELEERIGLYDISLTGLNVSNSQSLHEETSASGAEDLESKVRRLELDSSRLRERIRELEECEGAAAERDVVRGKYSELETELQIALKKNDELERKCKDWENSLETNSASTHGEVSSLKQQLEKVNNETSQWRIKLEQSEKRVDQAQQLQHAAEARLADKEKEMKDALDKNHAYLEKARLVIIEQDQQSRGHQQGGMSKHEFDSLRREAEAKDKEIKRLNEKLEQTRTMFEQEQRLITTSYYSMANRLMGYTQESQQSPKEKSFLAKQKQTSALNMSFFVVLILAGFYYCLSGLQTVVCPNAAPTHI